MNAASQVYSGGAMPRSTDRQTRSGAHPARPRSTWGQRWCLAVNGAANIVLEHEPASPTNALMPCVESCLGWVRPCAPAVAGWLRPTPVFSGGSSPESRKGKSMSETNGGSMPMDQVRRLLEIERREIAAQRRRERTVLIGSLAVMATALLTVCWWGLRS